MLGSCRAGTSPVPWPGHRMLTRVTPASWRVYHGAFPTLSCGLRMLCLPTRETEGSGDAPAVHNPQHPSNCPSCACRHPCPEVCSVRPLHPENMLLFLSVRPEHLAFLCGLLCCSDCCCCWPSCGDGVRRAMPCCWSDCPQHGAHTGCPRPDHIFQC